MESGIKPLSGFAIVDKPCGITSFTCINSLTRKLGTAVKSGHAGTLDSFASGLLVCLFGRYTRLSDYFMGAGKGYEADILFGEETDTLDPQGEIIATGPIPGKLDLEAVLPAFRGNILQVPPVYSAVHVAGERAYERARKGQEVTLAPRPVTIHSLELLSFNAGLARISVSCTKGTYIRSLARDIAIACGTRGRLQSLRRTFSGPFSIQEAVQAEKFSVASLKQLDIAAATGLGLGILRLESGQTKAFSNGLPLFRLASFEGLETPSPLAVFGESDNLLGIVSHTDTGWSYDFVLGAAD
jgi:tRNA pseudouridine55 synthase